MIIIKMIKRMMIKVINLINNIKKKKDNNYRSSWLFPIIFSKIDEYNNPDISYGVFLLSIIALICFINVIGFMIAYFFIQNKDYETKYPKLKKIINYYKKTTLVYAIIEGLLCFICLFILSLFSFLHIISVNN